MRRGWKVGIVVVVAIGLLLGLNGLITQRESKPAELTVPGGRILHLTGADLQVVEHGPRGAPPIVLVHCFTCAIDWWDAMIPTLERRHRVVAVDLLGHGGSEKPRSGYSIPHQADLVAEALGRLGVRRAEVVGHSLGGSIAVALAERSPALVDRVVILDTTSSPHEEGDLGLLAKLAFTPVIGEALWRIKPDFSVREGLEVAFAPGFDVPDAFIEDVDRMTYPAYDDSPDANEQYTEEEPLGSRMEATGKPLLVVMGEEEQIIDDPRAALRAYEAAVPGARTVLMPGVGHSPNVEAPARTAALVEGFYSPRVARVEAADRRAEGQKRPANRGNRQTGLQGALQKRDNVRESS
jgi:pimeloyl-ACP methyl ester carboxylesterase